MSAVLESAIATVRLNEDARFSFPREDSYWGDVMIALKRVYEPEITWLLKRASERPYAMLDCGANMGLWSIIASSVPYGRHSVVAIEPSLANFELLVYNANANGRRFDVLRRAVLDESEQRVRLYGRRHFALSVRQDWEPIDSAVFEEVETITIDDAAVRFFPNRNHPFLVKLDVEGAEIKAMQGGRRLFEEGALIIYEDHGKEPTHPISRFVLSQPNVDVWSLSLNGRPGRITDLAQVTKIKSRPELGYNFFTCKRCSPWASLFEDAASEPAN